MRSGTVAVGVSGFVMSKGTSVISEWLCGFHPPPTHTNAGAGLGVVQGADGELQADP
jgi:hypothetical protein